MPPAPRRVNDVVRLVVLWLAGIDLRLTLLAVPPVLPLIRRDLHLDESSVAALSTLPVLLLGLGAIPGSLLIARVGARRALLLGLVLIGVGSALRGVGSSQVALFAFTFVMGLGIAVSQPTFAALVRQWYPDTVTRATGVWSNGLLVGEMLGASLTLPFILPLVGGGWGASFAVWSIPVFLTAGLVAVTTTHASGDAAYWRGAGWPDWSSPHVWQLGLLQSAASLIYFGANTFIPDYLHETAQPDLVGPALATLNTLQLPASVVVGLVPWRLLAQPSTSVGVGIVTLVALAGILSGQPPLILAAAGVLGFAAAYILVLSFAIPALLAAPRDVSRLSSGGFTVGYTTAFVATVAAGALWDNTHLAASAFLPVLLGAASVSLFGPRLLSASSHAHAVGAVQRSEG